MTVVPAQIRHGRWVVLNTGEKKYIGDVDYNGEISPVGHFSLYVVDEPGKAEGEWIGIERVQSVKGANPYQDEPHTRPTDLGVAQWSNTTKQMNELGEVLDNPESLERIRQQVFQQAQWPMIKPAEKQELKNHIWALPNDKLVHTARAFKGVGKKMKESHSIDPDLQKCVRNGKMQWKLAVPVLQKKGQSEDQILDFIVNSGYSRREAMNIVDAYYQFEQNSGTGPQSKGPKTKGSSGTGMIGESGDHCAYCGKGLKWITPIEADGQKFCSSACQKTYDKVAAAEADYKDPSLTTKQKQSSWKREIFKGIDEPASLTELVDDVKILAKIDKLRDDNEKLQKIPTTDAYGVSKKIKKNQDEIAKLEKQLYGELPALDRDIHELKTLIEVADTMITTDQLVWNKNTNTFTAEVSDIGQAPNSIYVKNPKTGKRVSFHFVKKEFDREGEVTAFWYQSIDGKYKLEIFND